MSSDLEIIRNTLREFAAERDWNKFHTPKNLAMALAGEAGELVAEFQWLSPEESQKLNKDQFNAVEMEIADVAIYLIRLADMLNINIYEAAMAKIHKNKSRFPSQ
ncbi:MAG: nucleotide pyrophosphohydrolase [Actinobacteria bacterium]|nr:nucleotide pyrophosphohydrolase [Actinomycetota bacterium]